MTRRHPVTKGKPIAIIITITNNVILRVRFRVLYFLIPVIFYRRMFSWLYSTHSYSKKRWFNFQVGLGVGRGILTRLINVLHRTRNAELVVLIRNGISRPESQILRSIFQTRNRTCAVEGRRYWAEQHEGDITAAVSSSREAPSGRRYHSHWTYMSGNHTFTAE